MPQRKYSRSEVASLLERVLTEIGPDRFSTLRLMELEKLVRSHDAAKMLPGKTLLREVINQFRVKRWPSTAPKKVPRR